MKNIILKYLGLLNLEEKIDLHLKGSDHEISIIAASLDNNSKIFSKSIKALLQRRKLMVERMDEMEMVLKDLQKDVSKVTKELDKEFEGQLNERTTKELNAVTNLYLNLAAKLADKYPNIKK